MVGESKETIFKEWEERNKRNDKQKAVKEIRKSVDLIAGWLSNLKIDETERSESYKLPEDDREAMLDYLAYIRVLLSEI